MGECLGCKEKFFSISTDSFVAGVLVKNKKIIKAAPILKWSIGKTLSQLEDWLRTKNGKIQRCNDVKIQKEIE